IWMHDTNSISAGDRESGPRPQIYIYNASFLSGPDRPVNDIPPTLSQWADAPIKYMCGRYGVSFDIARCLIPRFDGAILSLEWKEAIWDRFVTAAPRWRS